MARTKSNTDQVTLDLIKQVQAKKDQIAQIEKPQYKTNCSFSYTPGNRSGAIALHAETDIRKLISIAAYLLMMNDHYVAAAKHLDVQDFPVYLHDGFSAADWVHDIRNRIAKLQIAAERDKLQKLEDRLNKIVSPELRARLEIEAIAAELS